jgi:hypothetical protein
VFELGRWPNYAYGCDCNYLMCVCCVFVCVCMCVYVCVCVSLSVTNEWRLKYFKQASRYLGRKWATYCRCVSLSACCRIPSYQLRQPANLRITFRRVTCSDDRLNLNIACIHLRDDQWKNDDSAPAAASESFGIKVLIYSGLFGASQRQEPFVGAIWPIIGTTQGVASICCGRKRNSSSRSSRRGSINICGIWDRWRYRILCFRGGYIDLRNMLPQLSVACWIKCCDLRCVQWGFRDLRAAIIAARMATQTLRIPEVLNMKIGCAQV